MLRRAPLSVTTIRLSMLWSIVEFHRHYLLDLFIKDTQIKCQIVHFVLPFCEILYSYSYTIQFFVLNFVCYVYCQLLHIAVCNMYCSIPQYYPHCSYSLVQDTNLYISISMFICIYRKLSHITVLYFFLSP